MYWFSINLNQSIVLRAYCKTTEHSWDPSGNLGRRGSFARLQKQYCIWKCDFQYFRCTSFIDLRRRLYKNKNKYIHTSLDSLQFTSQNENIGHRQSVHCSIALLLLFYSGIRERTHFSSALILRHRDFSAGPWFPNVFIRQRWKPSIVRTTVCQNVKMRSKSVYINCYINALLSVISVPLIPARRSDRQAHIQARQRYWSTTFDPIESIPGVLIPGVARSVRKRSRPPIGESASSRSLLRNNTVDTIVRRSRKRTSVTGHTGARIVCRSSDFFIHCKNNNY